MTDPLTTAIISRLVDSAFTAFETGLEREFVLAKVSDWGRAGKTPDEIADSLAQLRRDSSAAAREK